MKTTKNQAAAVRSYLATLGVSISHVQALEVIARGAGLRSRHVKAQAEEHKSPAEAKFEEALALCAKRPYPAGASDTVKELMALLPELFATEAQAEAFLVDSLDQSVLAAADEVCLTNVIRKEYIAAGRTQAALAVALRKLVESQVWGFKDYHTAYMFLTGAECYAWPLVTYQVEVLCKVCGTRLDSKGYCKDGTCVHSDWPQGVEREDLYEMSTADVERKYNVKKRVRVQPEDRADDIKASYFDSGCSRGDLEEALSRLMEECTELFENEDAAMAFLLEVHAGEALPSITGEAQVQSTRDIMAKEWTPADIAEAQRQGWDIFETNRDDEDAQQMVNGKPYGHRPFELQRDDEQGLFEDDAEAHAFVRNAAQNGDPVAKRALAFLEKHSPAEYAAVMAAPSMPTK